MTTTANTLCPDWCTVDHDAEAARLRARDASEGNDFSYDPDSFVTPCMGAALTARVNDGCQVGVRPVREVHEAETMFDLFMTLPDGREGSIDEPLSLVEAQALVAILTTLVDA